MSVKIIILIVYVLTDSRISEGKELRDWIVTRDLPSLLAQGGKKDKAKQ